MIIKIIINCSPYIELKAYFFPNKQIQKDRLGSLWLLREKRETLGRHCRFQYLTSRWCLSEARDFCLFDFRIRVLSPFLPLTCFSSSLAIIKRFMLVDISSYSGMYNLAETCLLVIKTRYTTSDGESCVCYCSGDTLHGHWIFNEVNMWLLETPMSGSQLFWLTGQGNMFAGSKLHKIHKVFVFYSLCKTMKYEHTV